MAIIKTTNRSITGTILPANLGSGTANSGTALFGDQTYKSISSYDDDKVVNDISTLALHQATNNNSAKYNLTNSNVDVYQDSSAIANLVNVTRDTSGEYISSVSQSGTAVPTNTKLYLKANSVANGSTSITDYSGTSTPVSMVNGAKHFSASDVPIGATSGTKSTTAFWFDGNNQRIQSTYNSALATKLTLGTNDFTVACWYRTNNASAGSAQTIISFGGAGNNTNYKGWSWFYEGNNTMKFYYKNNSGAPINNASSTLGVANDTWVHLAITRESGTLKFWANGVQKGSASNITNNINEFDSIDLRIGTAGDGTNDVAGLMDDIIINNGTALYTSNFTAPTVYYGLNDVSNATGNYQSTAQTANASVNKISGVVTYTNASGTNTLNTDIIMQVSADNGSTFTNAPLTAAGTFSTGVLQAVTNDISVTAGTQLKYKIFFANQASGSKVARINGVSLSY